MVIGLVAANHQNLTTSARFSKLRDRCEVFSGFSRPSWRYAAARFTPGDHGLGFTFGWLFIKVT